MAFLCVKCEQQFENKNDGERFFDQDTGKPHHVCHDCLILDARPRQWFMKIRMQRKMQAMKQKREEELKQQ